MVTQSNPHADLSDPQTIEDAEAAIELVAELLDAHGDRGRIYLGVVKHFPELKDTVLDVLQAIDDQLGRSAWCVCQLRQNASKRDTWLGAG